MDTLCCRILLSIMLWNPIVYCVTFNYCITVLARVDMSRVDGRIDGDNTERQCCHVRLYNTGYGEREYLTKSRFKTTIFTK